MIVSKEDKEINETEADLIERAIRKDEVAIRSIIQTNNRRLFRIARGVVRDDQEAEDVLQESYVKAFSAISDFRRDSRLSTWLCRIVLNEALQRVRQKRGEPLSHLSHSSLPVADVISFPSSSTSMDPERVLAQSQICKLLESAIDRLPDDYRAVLIARTIEGMSIEETAEVLNLRAETVKTRLHRARGLLREALSDHIEPHFIAVFPFDGARCEKFTNGVLKKIVSIRV